MGTTTSSAQRDSRGEEDAAAEELSAAGSDARDDGSADDKLFQKNGQISILNVKTRDRADELNGQFEERVLADVGSGFVNLKEDGTETIEDLQDLDSLQPNIKNESGEMVNAGVTLKEETEVENSVNDINEVGFKKIFRFVGFKFTLKKDALEKTEVSEEKVTEEDEQKEADVRNESDVAIIKVTPEETHKSEVSSQPDATEPPQQTDNEREPDQDINIVEYHMEETPGKELDKESSPELEEPMSPIKQFFTQGIFASLRKKKKEEDLQKETKEEEPKGNENLAVEEAEKEDSKCMCLDIPYILSEEEKDAQEKADDNLLPVGDLQNSLEKDKVQGSPLKRLFRKFSSRRQRTAEKVIEVEEQVSEQPKSSLEVTELGKAEEPIVGEPKPADDDLMADIISQESKKKSDTTVSWEALICGGSAKKKARKTTEDESPGQEFEKTSDSPLGSSVEGDYDHLTSSNEQSESPAEGEMGSTWKTFKKMVTPKRKVRAGESSTPEQIPSDSEMSKEDSLSKKKLIPGHKKRKSDARQDRTIPDEAAKDHETGEEDDETPAIIPLSEYEVIEPEVLKEMLEQRVEITIEQDIPEMISEVSEQETSKIVPKVSSNAGPKIIHSISEDFEELTDFLSKHQQLSDIPEEGIIEESIETPVSSAEWTTQDDTLAEDIVELTADAVTAPEPDSEEIIGDDTTEMVSALSQLTESARSSGHVTPVPVEYDVQTSDMILQEAIQSICMTPSVQSVTTKDENHESLAVSFSPYIIQSSTPEETKVLVAHKKTEATSICIGLVSEEMEGVEEHLLGPLVEALHEVSDAVPTELVSDNFTDEHEVAGLGIDEVYEAEIKDVKTEYQDIIVNEEVTTDSEREQDVQLVTKPLVEESEESQDKKEEDTTSTELRPDIETKQSESGLDQVMSESTHRPADEPTQAMHTEVVEQETVDKILKKSAKDVTVEDNASAMECLEVNITPISDPTKPETTVLEDNLQTEDVQSDVQKDAVLQEGEKTEESGNGKAAQQEEVIRDVQNIKAENTSETVDELIAANETLLIEPALKYVHKETTDTDLGDKVEDNASNTTDQICVKEELALKEGQPLTDTECNETENQDLSANLNTTDKSPDLVLAETEKAEMGEEHTVVPELSKEVLEPTEKPTEPEVILTEAEVKPVPTEIVSLQIEEGSQVTKQNDEPVTSENINAGKVLEMVAIIENTTRQPEQENAIVAEPEGQEMTISELPEARGREGNTSEMTVVHVETKDGVQTPVETSTEKEETAFKPEGVDSGATVSEEVAVTVLAKNDAATEEQKIETDEDAMQKCEPIGVVNNEHTKDKIQAVTEVIPTAQVPPLSTEVTVSEAQTQVVSELRAATLEVTEPKVEIPVVTEVKVETAVVTDLEVERPVVTSVVTELEVETPVVTSTTKTTDDYNSQNIKTNTSVIEELVTEKPTAISVVVTPATPLDEVTPVITQSNESMVAAKVEDTSVGTGAAETPKVESVIVRTVVAPSVEIQNVTPVIEIPSSVIATEDSSPVIAEAAVGHTLVEATVVETTVVTALKPTVVEIPVVQTPDVGAVIMSSAITSVPPQEVNLDVTLIAETPLSKVIGTPVESVKPTVAAVTQTTVAEKPAVIPDTITEAACPVAATPVVTPVASERILISAVESPDATSTAMSLQTPSHISAYLTKAEAPIPTSAATSAVIPLVETVRVTDTSVISVTAAVETPVTIPIVQTPVVKLSSVAVVETPVVTPLVKTPGEVSERAKETAPSAVVSSEETPPVIPAEESPVAMIEAPVVSLTVQPPCQGLVTVTEMSSPAVVSGITVTGKTLVVSQVEQTPFVIATEATKATVVTLVEQTPDQGSVTVAETAPQAVVLGLETPPMTVVQTPVVQPTQVGAVQAPAVTQVVQIPAQGSNKITEATPPAIASTVKTPPISVAVETPVVKLTQIGEVEAHMPPVVQEPGSITVTENLSPAVVSGVTATVETHTVIPLVETPVGKSTTVAVVEPPVVPPLVQTLGQSSIAVTETSSAAVVSGVTATVETPTETPVVETPVVKSTTVAVFEAPVVPPVVQTPGQGSITATKTSTPAVVSGVTATDVTPTVIHVVETPVVQSTPVAVVEIPVVTPMVQAPDQVLEIIKETTPPLLVSAVEIHPMIPVAETPVVMSTHDAVVEVPVVPPVVQTPDQGSVGVTETAPPVASALTAPLETPSVITVVETPPVKSTPVAEVEMPVVTPVVQTPGQDSVIVKETAPPAIVLTVKTFSEIPVVATTVAVVEVPAESPVKQVACQGSVSVTETAPQAVVSSVETPLMMPGVETPVVKSTPVAVVEVPVVTPVVQAPDQGSPPEVVSVITAAVETPAVIPAVETLVVTSTPVSVVEVPVVTPVVQTPGQSSPPEVVSGVSAGVEIPAVETPVVTPAPVSVVEVPVVTPVVQTPGQGPPTDVVSGVTAVVETPAVAVVETPVKVLGMVAESSTAVVETPTVIPVVETSAVVQISGQILMRVTETSPTAVAETPVVETPAAVVKTPVLTPVVETPVIKPIPTTVPDTPALTPIVQTTRQVLVTLTETAPPVVVSAVTATAEKPVVIPVETTEIKPTLVAESPIMKTSTVTSIAERSVVSLVLETTAPTTIALTERPVMIPVVQTPALVSVIVKETPPPVVLPPVNTGAEIPVKSTVVESLVGKPTLAVAETAVLKVHASAVTPVEEHATQTPTAPAGIESPAVISEEKAQQQTQVADTLAQAPVMVTPPMTPVVVAPATAPPVVTPELKEATIQVIPHDTNEANTESFVEFEDAVQVLVSAKEVQTGAKGSLPHEPVVTSIEAQLEVEEDVWEDAVDIIGDSQCQLTHTEGEPQDTAAKQPSDAVI